jgi:S-adenosylmethionine/arginine decarboxylase-like enzyme
LAAGNVPAVMGAGSNGLITLIHYKMANYGKELIIDLHGCDAGKFNRKSLRRYFKELCQLIDMQRAKLVFWDDVGVPEEQRQTLPHTKGTSAVQFILTSSIVIHTLDIMEVAYINIFSCKEFDSKVALDFTVEYFKAKTIKQSLTIKRI